MVEQSYDFNFDSTSTTLVLPVVQWMIGTSTHEVNNNTTKNHACERI
jgi:hypothetical protein